MSARIVRECPKCNGSGISSKDTVAGIVTTNPCHTCNGDKFILVYELEFDDFQSRFDSIEAKLDQILDGPGQGHGGGNN